MKILVIDDEKPTLAMFRLFLTACGYDVLTAEDGQKGLALFHENRPDIVFTDIKMPGMDGLEVLRRIGRSKIPCQVIVITGHGDMERALEALDLNASDFINKPVERKALNAALNRAEKRRNAKEPSPLKLSAREEPDRLVITVKGKLTGAGETDLKSCLPRPDTGEPPHAVIFRFDDDFAIDRRGIALLTATIQELKPVIPTIILDQLTCNYARIFKMTGLDKLAAIKESEPEE